MKNIYIAIVFVLTCNWVYSQEEENIFKGQKLSLDTVNIDEKKELPAKLSTSFNSGVSFMSLGQYGSVFSTFVNPNLNYRVSPKFSLSTGVFITNNNFNLKDVPGGEDNFGNNSIFSNYVYAQGTYKINNNLTVSGAVITEVGNLDQQKYVNPSLSSTNFKSTIIGFSYKFSNNARIDAVFNFQEGRNPFGYENRISPYNSHYSPYNPYRNIFGW